MYLLAIYEQTRFSITGGHGVAVAMSGLPSQHDQGQEKMLGPSHHRHLIQLFIRETYHPVHDTPAENQAATDI